MMKRIAAMLLCCLLVLLCGCGDRNPPTPTTTPTPAVTEAPTPTPTLVPTATPEPTPTAVPIAAPLYTEQITYADQSIYDAPTYDGCFVGTVQQAGIYTIMEEVRDDEGNLWGRLKSGVGWVDLTEIRARREMPVPITANYADAALIAGGHYHHYVGEASDYAVQIAFRAHERLTDFVLCSMVFNEDMERGEDLYALAELTSDKPLVAELVFPGDMSSFGVTFTDGAGNLRSYMVFMSGRNGSIVFTEIAP